MQTDQPESATGKPPETAFQRLRRHRLIAAMGLLLIAIGIVPWPHLFVVICLSRAAGRQVGPWFLWPLAFLLSPLPFIGAALILIVLVRKGAARVASVMLLLLIATALIIYLGYGEFGSGCAPIKGKSYEEVSKLYEQIQNGMTQKSVAALLGRPTYIYRYPAYESNGGVECWRYENGAKYYPFAFCDFLEVRFSTEGKVVDKYLGD